jgi:polar amino acid transport system substrate-binding protein
MRTLLAAILLVALGPAIPSAGLESAQAPPLRLVSTPWPPFTNEPGRPRFALDLVETALGKVGLKANTIIVEPAQFTTALLTGEFDGSGAAWRDAERERVLLFSQPYLENRLILVGRRGDDVSAAALPDLKAKRVAIVEGYSYGDSVDKSGIIVVRSRSDEDSLALLLSSKADYALMDDVVVQYLVDHYPNEATARLNLGSRALIVRELHVAVRRTRPDAASIVEKFNAQLRGLIADRTYHRLLHVSWIRADVDGDGLTEFIPQTDRPGSKAPDRAYSLFTMTPDKSTNEGRRFYVGGNIYSDWASVPNRYKVEDPKRPDPARSTASIFRFTW